MPSKQRLKQFDNVHVSTTDLMCVAGLSAVQEEELGQGEDNVTIEDVTNNPAAQANLDNTHDQNIIEPDPDGHALVRFVYVFASHAVFRKAHMLSSERCAGECIGSLDIFVMKEYELHAAQLEAKRLLLGIILGIEKCKYEISV